MAALNYPVRLIHALRCRFRAGLIFFLAQMAGILGPGAPVFASGYSPANQVPLSEADKTLQVLDAQHFGPTVNGGITQPATAALGAPNATTCVTDGCSVLIVREKAILF